MKFDQSIAAGAIGVSGVSVRRVVVLGLKKEHAQRQLWGLLMELAQVNQKTNRNAKYGTIVVNKFQVLSHLFKRYIVYHIYLSLDN